MPWYDWEDDYENKYDEEERTSDAIVLQGPLSLQSKRGAVGTTWWGQQWVAAMQKPP